MSYEILDIKTDLSTLYQTSYSIPRAYYNFTQYADMVPNYSVTRYYQYSMAKSVSINTNDFYRIKTERSSEAYKNFVYPMAVRYISKNGTYVVERPPFQLEVDYRIGSAHSGNPKIPSIKIWVPWTLMVFSANAFANGNFTNAGLYFNSGPLESMDQKLVTCFYPNTYSNSKICFSNSLSDFGSVLDTTEFEKGNIGYIYNYIFNNYMMGGWNADLEQNLNRYNVPQVDLDKYPTIKLFHFPTSDPEFYKKIVNVFPKEFFRKLKRYYQEDFYLFQGRISREKIFARNFGVFAAFTLEQKINFIKELQQFSEEKKKSNNYHRTNTSTLAEIIHHFETNEVKTQSSVGPSSLARIADAPLVYDYESYIFDIYIDNCPPNQSSYYNVALRDISSNVYSQMHRNMIDHINSKTDSSIAFVVDIAAQTYEVIINYDKRSYLINQIQKIKDVLVEATSDNSSYEHVPVQYVKRIKQFLTSVETAESMFDKEFQHS